MAATGIRLKTAAACLIVFSLLPVSGASAFYCYVPEKPESPVALREKPDDGAKLVLRMPPGSMVRSTKGVRERNGWVHVLWYQSQASKKEAGKGWVRHDLIYGGECED
jgi:hypothetical protein